ncbi:hypothetical protein HHL23_18480 [Chryseobacterium sp. RP-3-3]|uniref:Tetratricopeptide repeat protein n=1 Tax=Chryseobacterium antibioticum TaxID=2728847 RepID=A0A7Y0AQS2_9FLAO|nr:tetratricopeptide repeat protein [Chryseobacterium antibioticum]NML71768.1 hypothetical protein [Chryseobacterium antibioticum]
MRKYISFFLIFILIKTSSQINKQQLVDNWARVKSSMLDGSRDLSESPERFLIWKLSDNKICEYIDPIFEERKTCFDIKIENTSIRTSPKTFYEIDKLTNDTLVVIGRSEGITSHDKIKKMWFVRTSKFQHEYLNTLKNDSIVIATPYFTPSLKKNIFSDVLERSMTNNDRNLNINGNIIIHPKKQKIDFQFENQDQSKKNLENIEFLKSTVEKSYHLWNLAGLEKFDQIIIPYRIEIQIKYINTFKGSTIKFAFFKSDHKDLNNIPVTIKDKMLSNETYNKGMNALENQKLDKAIELFNKAFDLDNTNIDALYNTASISLNKEDVTTACTALKKLKDLEQAEGTKLFNEICSKN